MTKNVVRVACIGECMVELAHLGPSDLRLGYAGDTLNTAVYLRRLTDRDKISVDYVTALGDDPYSEAMLTFWQQEGLGTGLVARLAGRLPGLYTIRTDADGERHFTYWRAQSAARDLLQDGRSEALARSLRDATLVYLSGITLSILDRPQRDCLFNILDDVRAAGGKIAFDSNFRPASWSSNQEAGQCFHAMLERTDIALPTLEDERKLAAWGDARALADHLHKRGVRQIVIKLGRDGCFVSDDKVSQFVETRPITPMIDSTAAGDSFNAAFLAGWLRGKPAVAAATDGHQLAARVVKHRGAILPLAAMADLIGLSPSPR